MPDTPPTMGREGDTFFEIIAEDIGLMFLWSSLFLGKYYLRSRGPKKFSVFREDAMRSRRKVFIMEAVLISTERIRLCGSVFEK